MSDQMANGLGTLACVLMSRSEWTSNPIIQRKQRHQIRSHRFITVTPMSQRFCQWLLLVSCLLLSGVSLGQVSEENASVQIEQQTHQAVKKDLHRSPTLAKSAG